ncbi:YceI family protein [Breoghania sp.]|uniref:YceI family protein n=1 Tax=Breoghania sp. TaxID=2065378 RepID=UPI0029CA3EBA|nr:YceI family protein [Breoghania sp.]
MNIFLRTAAVLALVSAPLAFAPAANAAEWAVDHDTSSLTFSVRHGEKIVSGSFSDWDAAIDFDPEKTEAATIKVNVKTGSVATDDGQMGKTLTGEAWLDTGSFEQATFSSDEVVPTGEGSYDAIGTLTIRGISMPMTLPFVLDIKGDKAHAKGGSTLQRLDYKIGSQIDENTLDGVVKVEFDLNATKK